MSGQIATCPACKREVLVFDIQVREGPRKKLGLHSDQQGHCCRMSDELLDTASTERLAMTNTSTTSPRPRPAPLDAESALDAIGQIVGWGSNPAPDDPEDAIYRVLQVLNRFVAGGSVGVEQTP